ncbi:MAG: polysaccharide deacetylase family protein [Solirubrobacteraceae bacterium]
MASVDPPPPAGGYLGRTIRTRLSSASTRAAAALLAALALASVAVALLSLGSGAADLETATASSRPAAAHGPPSYRIVGCVSGGTLAHRSGPARREVAIGFDDGPAADTPSFVRMLERSHARATFFMIGRQVNSRFRPTLLRELRDGDTLGDHTFNHPDLLLRGLDVRRELASTIAAIHAQSGYTPCLFRPPYGAFDEAVVRTARALGLSTIMWNDDPSDYAQPGTAAIVQRVLAQVRPGSILISHDGGGPRGQTLAAYPRIIAKLRARGYAIVTVEQLLGYRPVYEPCAKLCDGLGLARAQLPRNAVVRKAR